MIRLSDLVQSLRII